MYFIHSLSTNAMHNILCISVFNDHFSSLPREPPYAQRGWILRSYSGVRLASCIPCHASNLTVASPFALLGR